MARRARGPRTVPGARLGHATADGGSTGVTVVVLDAGAPAVVDVRGGASGTYDTASLALEATFGRRWALFVAGGSLYGLDAARGVRARLVEEGHGFRPFGSRILLPSISGAVIYDLPVRATPLPDYAELGYEATRAARRSAWVQGRVGAGAGATVGKYLGRARAMPGGLGLAVRDLGNGATVGVLTVVNAAGAVRDPGTGAWIAGARGRGGRIVPPDAAARRRLAGRGTTISIVITDLALDRPALSRVGAIVHAGVGRAVVPYLTSVDGDLVFVASTGLRARRGPDPWPGASADRVGRGAAEAAVDAIRLAVGGSGPAVGA